jgi:hypothetical protein
MTYDVMPGGSEVSSTHVKLRTLGGRLANDFADLSQRHDNHLSLLTRIQQVR